MVVAPPAAARSELRKSPFDDEWVMYAPARARVVSITDGGARPACPFCPGSEEAPGAFDVLVLPNRYPSFTTEPAPVAASAGVREAYGRQDVFVFSPEHDAALADQTPERVATLLRALGRRTRALFEDPSIEAVVAFENAGRIFGPSVEHPHGQVFSLPFVPRRLEPRPGPCIQCAGPPARNVVAERRRAHLSCPPHARFPYEMHVVPHAHAAALYDLPDAAVDDVARLLLVALRALRRAAGGDAAYMLLIYQAPRPLLHDYHLRLEVVPVAKPGGGRKYLGGLELGFGVYVNPSLPEESAATLRECAGR